METALRGSGPQRDIEMQVDPTFQAARFTLRPVEYSEAGKAGIGGHYYVSAFTGALTGVTANSPIFSAKWGDSRLLCILKRVSVWYNISTAYTGAQMNDFELICVTGFTAADTGGTQLAPVPKRRSAMSQGSVFSTAPSDMRISSTAGLTAGTRTLDAAALRAVIDGPANVAVPTATLAVPRAELVLFDSKEMGAHPKVFGKDEGFIVRMPTAMGAAGVIRACVAAEWAEVVQY